MTTLQFHNLAALHWLWGVLGAMLILLAGAARRRRRLHAFASERVLGRLTAAARGGRAAVRGGLLLCGLLLLAAGLLDPRWGVTYQEVQQRGIDIMVVLDVSRSMLAQDVRPDRLERARQYAQDLVRHLAGDRVGLITFAGNPALNCPLTVDYGAFVLSLLESEPELIGRGGSMLGDALRLAGESFTDEAREFKAVIVFTDGEDMGSFPVEAAAELLAERGVKTYTVGLGDAQTGARIPLGGGRGHVTHEGQEVWSRQDPALLREVALRGGGAYVPAGTGNVDMGRVYEEHIAPATRREFGATRLRLHEVRYQWFAAAALALLVAEGLVAARPRRGAAEPEGSP
jgi:Ca-activated chloride channel family protein